MTIVYDITQLSGLITGTTGLNPRVLNLEKNFLGMPSSQTYSDLVQSNNSQFNALTVSINDLVTTVNDLTSYIVNLKQSHNDLSFDFTGFTGNNTISGLVDVTLTGALSTGQHLVYNSIFNVWQNT